MAILSLYLTSTNEILLVFVNSRYKDKSKRISQMPDHGVVCKDAVLGLLRMDFIPRLTFILKGGVAGREPDPHTRACLLAACVRLCRHSKQAANLLLSNRQSLDICLFVCRAYVDFSSPVCIFHHFSATPPPRA